MHLRGKTLLANAFHAPDLGDVEVLEDTLFDIDAEGAIAAVIRPCDPSYRDHKDKTSRDGTLVATSKHCFLLPGFVDCHVHAPQYPQLGNALDVPLEVWLQKYTFPLEARYTDLEFARHSYELLVQDLLANGTTTALYFATIHQEATRLLVDICARRGQRALIGKVAMDLADTCPETYRDASPQASIDGTRLLIDYITRHADNRDGLIKPVVTPRFIPACSDAALEGLGELARDCGCHVQTHCSESDWEHDQVLSRYGMTDTESLDRFGLLGRRTMLAHANFLTPSDMTRIAQRQAAVAHCPLSNGYFAGAVFPLRAALEKGLHVGLGTDISGGPSASLLDNARAAILVSRMLETGVDSTLVPHRRAFGAEARIDFRHAFHLATAGGAAALDLPVGQFRPGYQFDAVIVDAAAEKGSLRLFDEFDFGETILQKIILTASRANIAQVFVAGRQVS